MKFFKKLIHLLKAPKSEIEHKPIDWNIKTKENELRDLLRKYHLLKNIKDEMVRDIKTKKRLKYKLEWIKGDIIELAKKI